MKTCHQLTRRILPACLAVALLLALDAASPVPARVVVVPDVHAFPGHIACDSRSASEIVVPLFDDRQEVWAVLDVDSM